MEHINFLHSFIVLITESLLLSTVLNCNLCGHVAAPPTGLAAVLQRVQMLEWVHWMHTFTASFKITENVSDILAFGLVVDKAQRGQGKLR